MVSGTAASWAISLKPKPSVQSCAFPVWGSNEAETFRPNHRHNNTEFVYPSPFCRRDIPGSVEASMHSDPELLGMSARVVFVPDGWPAAFHRLEVVSLLRCRSFWKRRHDCRKNDLRMDMSFWILPRLALQNKVLQNEITQILLLFQICHARRCRWSHRLCHG